MKRIWIALGILLTVIAACVGMLWWQLHALDDLQTGLAQLESAVKEHATDTIQRAEQFCEQCRQVTETMAALSRHVDSSPLRESAALLPVLLKRGEYSAFFAEAARCRFYLKELQHNEKPLFRNIF